MRGAQRMQRAFAALDAANAGDPHVLILHGEARPKERAHAELACGWVRKLQPEAGELLLLAARAHHLRRWELPRAAFPAGRAGYLAWRREAQRRHAACARRILAEAGYAEAEQQRVCDLVQKRGLARGDTEAQALEDALCLVFLETQLAALHGRLGAVHTEAVLRKTLRKMSAAAISHALALPLAGAERALLLRAHRAEA